MKDIIATCRFVSERGWASPGTVSNEILRAKSQNENEGYYYYEASEESLKIHKEQLKLQLDEPYKMQFID